MTHPRPTNRTAWLIPNVTLAVYGHLTEDALAEAAELYDPLREAIG